MDNQVTDNTTPLVQPVTVVAPPTYQKAPINQLGLWSFLLTVAFIPIIYITAIIIGVIIGAAILNGDIKLKSSADTIYGFAAPVYALMYAQLLVIPALITSLILGIVSFSKKGTRNGLGITGVCLSSLGILVSLIVVISGMVS